MRQRRVCPFSGRTSSRSSSRIRAVALDGGGQRRPQCRDALGIDQWELLGRRVTRGGFVVDRGGLSARSVARQKLPRFSVVRRSQPVRPRSRFAPPARAAEANPRASPRTCGANLSNSRSCVLTPPPGARCVGQAAPGLTRTRRPDGADPRSSLPPLGRANPSPPGAI